MQNLTSGQPTTRLWSTTFCVSQARQPFFSCIENKILKSVNCRYKVENESQNYALGISRSCSSIFITYHLPCFLWRRTAERLLAVIFVRFAEYKSIEYITANDRRATSDSRIQLHQVITLVIEWLEPNYLARVRLNERLEVVPKRPISAQQKILNIHE